MGSAAGRPVACAQLLDAIAPEGGGAGTLARRVMAGDSCLVSSIDAARSTGPRGPNQALRRVDGERGGLLMSPATGCEPRSPVGGASTSSSCC